MNLEQLQTRMRRDPAYRKAEAKVQPGLRRFGLEVMRARELRRLSRRDLAAELEASEILLKFIEEGKAADPALAAAVAKFLQREMAENGYDAEEFLNGLQEEAAPPVAAADPGTGLRRDVRPRLIESLERRPAGKRDKTRKTERT